MLFLGEWVFGSIGWGLLHGTELLIAVAVLSVLLALRIRGLLASLLIAAVIGLVAAVILGPNLANELWRRIGDGLNLGDAAWRPLASGVLVLAVIGGLAGLLLGARAGGRGAAVGRAGRRRAARCARRRVPAITFGSRAGVALGSRHRARGMADPHGPHASRAGIDTEALKARFWPQTTIDTTKETHRVGEGTIAARADVLAARDALDGELDRLEASARAAVDIPAKVKRNPGRPPGWRPGPASWSSAAR